MKEFPFTIVGIAILIVVLIAFVITVFAFPDPKHIPVKDYQIVHVPWKHQKADCVIMTVDNEIRGFTCDFPGYQGY